ncbi:GDYXXLXY domain-containing protein [Thermoactinomyces vulgaris]|jgi:uncharacterized membrane-anchored protein|uniref:GDYXXLXY domain-containing protein n=1 Tax=Thermoactinomyces TaxID=2023 RepID=UPI000506348B|nr:MULTISPECIES: GDYXXLXY domain-containing protein [Thermoactinomyces]KFZ40095.1 hypothetical protein JS81_09825 [Thermoactinomyces sp. Gus2-1]MCF6134456.1 GDYXXLXY domain-containing protein [Thermoactinomyces vulgaris]
MTNIPNRWFWIVLLIPVVSLVSMTVQPLLAFMSGERMTLKTIPVDPKDLFYGDYVRLKLEIEEVERSRFDPQLAQKAARHLPDPGIPVYVSLKPKGNHYIVDRVSEKKPPGGLYLKGTLQKSVFPFRDEEKYRVDYQLDRYYVEEGSGKKWEALAQNGGVLVEVKVKNGYGVIVGIEEDPCKS